MRQHPFRDTLPVLLIGPGRVEWLPAGEGATAQGATYAVDDARGQVEACLEAVRGLGCGRQPCLVALGPGWVESRTLELPALPRREFQRVLQRKAASLLSTKIEDTLFAALPLFGNRRAAAEPAPAATDKRAEPETREQPWLVLGMNRATVVPLLLGLRKLGLPARSVLCARLAAMGAAQARTQDPGHATLAVSVEPRAVSIGLLHEGALRFHSVMQGSLAEQPALAMSLLQELKSTEAWWRKHSRGGTVNEVVLLGLSGPRMDLLRGAIQNALPDALLATGEDHASEEAHQASVLAAARADGPLQLELGVRLPWRRRDTLAAATLAAAAIVLLGAQAYARFDEERQRIAAEVQRLEQESSELERCRAENEAAQRALASRLEQVTELSRMHTSGCDLDGLLHLAVECFDDHAALLRLAVARDGGARILELRGETDAHPASAMVHVLHIADELRQAHRFQDVVARPEDLGQISGRASGERPNAFEIRATLREDG